MASMVKVPKNQSMDYDYLAFSFNGFHSIEDFGIYRISENGMYKDNLNPSTIDKTADNGAADGQYFLDSKHRLKSFNIRFAFDSIDEQRLKRIKRWLDTDEICELWFAEAPHRVYQAKITGDSLTTTIVSKGTNGDRIYNGIGSIQFTCYTPYARTPDIVLTATGRILSGNAHTSYVDFSNYEQIKRSLPLSIDEISNEAESSAFGDLPFYFKANLLSPFDAEEITIISDIVGESYYIENATFSEEDGVYIIN